MKTADRSAKRQVRASEPAEADKLRDYAGKRAFEATPEPPAREAKRRSGPLLFVVQQHSARRLHYDFRLELDGVLKCWAVPGGPSLDPKVKRLAVPTEDHPFDYASFEGVIPPKQYGAGQVIVWDCGVYSPDEGQAYSFENREEAQQRMRAEYAQGKLSVFLLGDKLKGSWTLVRMKDKDWLLIKHKDRFARSDLDIVTRANSVLSGYTVADLKSPRRLERVSARAPDPIRSAGGLPGQTGADAGGRSRWPFQRSGVPVRAQARRLSLPGVAARRQGAAAVAARPGPERAVSRDRHCPAGAGPARLRPGRRDRRARPERQAVVPCFADARAAQERVRGPCGTEDHAVRVLCVRPAAPGWHEPARCRLSLPQTLAGPMPAAFHAPAGAARNAGGGRAFLRRGPGSRFRGHHRQAPRQPLRNRRALARLAEGQGHPDRRLPHLRLYGGQGTPRQDLRRAPARLSRSCRQALAGRQSRQRLRRRRRWKI